MLAGVNHLLEYLPVHWPVAPHYEGRQDTLDSLLKLRDCLNTRRLGRIRGGS